MLGHLSNFEDAQEMLDYEDYIYLGGAMTETQEDYHKEWEREFQEELCSQPFEDIE